jgi:hypothetical protein
MIGFDICVWSFGTKISDERIAFHLNILLGFWYLLYFFLLFLEIISMCWDLSLCGNSYHVCFLCFLLGFKEFCVGGSWTTFYGLDFLQMIFLKVITHCFNNYNNKVDLEKISLLYLVK